MRVLKSLVALFIAFTSVTYASEVEVRTIPPCEVSIESCVTHYAVKYDVSEQTLSKVISCESSWNPNAVNHTSKEYSVGLVQINLQAHTNITEEQARNPEFAIEFLAMNIAQGKGKMWTCYRV